MISGIINMGVIGFTLDGKTGVLCEYCLPRVKDQVPDLDVHRIEKGRTPCSGCSTPEVKAMIAEQKQTRTVSLERACISALTGKVCKTCGEPEDGGQFGWFDAEDGLHCNRCGHNPRKRRVLPTRR